MKKTLLAAGLVATVIAAQPAAAADLPARVPVKAPPPVVEVWTWDGWYLGLNGGYSWGRSKTDLSIFNNTTGALVASSSGTIKLNGGVFGGQLGFNRQNGSWVWGVEIDAQWTGERGDGDLFCNLVTCVPTAIAAGGAAGATIDLNQRIDWFATARGRLGIVPTTGWLAYVTGGAAFGGIKSNLTVAGFTAAGAPVSTSVSDRDIKFGWTAGGGIEARLTGNWIGRVEYLFLDFGKVSGSTVLLTSSPVLRGEYSSRIHDHVLRAAISYKFGPSSVVARY